MPHAGTFNGNPVTMIAGLTAMQMMTPEEYERLATLGDRVRNGANALFEDTGANWQMTGLTNMFRTHPNRRPLRSYRDSWRDADENARADAVYNRLMGHGVMLTPDGMGNISTAMGDSEVDDLLHTLERLLETGDV